MAKEKTLPAAPPQFDFDALLADLEEIPLVDGLDLLTDPNPAPADDPADAELPTARKRGAFRHCTEEIHTRCIKRRKPFCTGPGLSPNCSTSSITISRTATATTAFPAATSTA